MHLYIIDLGELPSPQINRANALNVVSVRFTESSVKSDIYLISFIPIKAAADPLAG